MTMNRHEPFEELISASLSGDLTAAERQRLDAHLDACPQCRDTLAAFADQRRIMSGLRHVGPPRDLGARVRTGIERGRFATLPWWRRPAVVFAGVGGSLAAVAGALLATVLLNSAPSGPEVGQSTPTPTVAEPTPSEAVRPTLPPIATQTAVASPAESAQPSVAPDGSEPPIEEPPEPDVVMVAVAEPSESVAVAVVEGSTGDEVAAVEPTTGGGADAPMAPSGPPIVAELSPDAQWLGFITENAGRGTSELWATRIGEGRDPVDPEATAPPESSIAIGETVHLGLSTAPSPFLERMSWSSDGRYLAFTIADPDTDDADTDAWVFDTVSGEARPVTDVGNAYAASFIPGAVDGTTNLWVSVASESPRSYLIEVPPGGEITPGDPAELGTHAADVFQPLLSPNGSLAIFWQGRMTSDPDGGWIFAEDGVPYLAEHDIDDGTFAFENDRKVFTDLPARGSLFASAAITWSLDGDAYAIWDIAWTGETSDAQPYPDATRVYFGHATDNRGMTRAHAIDRADIDPELVIVDIEVAPTGHHLLITARERPGGIGDAPRAELWMVTRHTGDVPDESRRQDVSNDGWVGPAVFLPEPEFDSSQAP